jgi:hypothetical protein
LHVLVVGNGHWTVNINACIYETKRRLFSVQQWEHNSGNGIVRCYLTLTVLELGGNSFIAHAATLRCQAVTISSVLNYLYLASYSLFCVKNIKKLLGIHCFFQCCENKTTSLSRRSLPHRISSHCLHNRINHESFECRLCIYHIFI